MCVKGNRSTTTSTAQALDVGRLQEKAELCLVKLPKAVPRQLQTSMRSASPAADAVTQVCHHQVPAVTDLCVRWPKSSFSCFSMMLSLSSSTVHRKLSGTPWWRETPLFFTLLQWVPRLLLWSCFSEVLRSEDWCIMFILMGAFFFPLTKPEEMLQNTHDWGGGETLHTGKLRIRLLQRI